MSISMAILKNGKAETWRVKLADEAIEYENDGGVYQQEGIGLQPCIVHACVNMGEPFDSARHRAAAAVWAAVENMERKPFDKARRNDAIAALRIIWDNTK